VSNEYPLMAMVARNKPLRFYIVHVDFGDGGSMSYPTFSKGRPTEKEIWDRLIEAGDATEEEVNREASVATAAGPYDVVGGARMPLYPPSDETPEAKHTRHVDSVSVLLKEAHRIMGKMENRSTELEELFQHIGEVFEK